MIALILSLTVYVGAQGVRQLDPAEPPGGEAETIGPKEWRVSVRPGKTLHVVIYGGTVVVERAQAPATVAEPKPEPDARRDKVQRGGRFRNTPIQLPPNGEFRRRNFRPDIGRGQADNSRSNAPIVGPIRTDDSTTHKTRRS
jgi:hypothetical protein